MEKKVKSFLFEEKLYQGEFQAVLEAYDIQETPVVLDLLKRMAELGKPIPTKMFKIGSKGVQTSAKVNVYVPLGEIRHNAEWFAISSLLCELVFMEKIWKESKIFIERESVKYRDRDKNERFNSRFTELLENSIHKKSEYEAELRRIGEMIPYVRGIIFAKDGSISQRASVQEKWESIGLYPEWQFYAENPTIRCLDMEAEKEFLCENFGRPSYDGAGFWADLLDIYMM